MRIVVCYNKRSSRFREISREVLEPLEEMAKDSSAGSAAKKGAAFEIHEFEVKKASVSENARRLSKVLRQGDIVISAGGDGTATAVLNGVILSGLSNVRFSALPYGNFNDMARLFGVRRLSDILGEDLDNSFAEDLDARTRELYPLEMSINGRHFRYAACYFTIGMFAESTEAFNNARVRKSLISGKRSLFFSVTTLFSWWRKNRKKQFFPADFPATDVLAINGRSVAKMMKGDARLAFSGVGFLASKQKLSGFFSICWFMIRSIIRRVPGKVADSIKLGFSKSYEVEIQAEGEYERKKCREIIIQKSDKPVQVICRK